MIHTSLYCRVMLMLSALCFLVLTEINTSQAQTGVSDNRVSLPDGPGSVSGFTDNAEINQNMGTMSFSVKISAPKGVGSEFTELSLKYSSLSGNSLVGMGWSLPISSIERSTSKGLPRYQRGDRFVVDESMKIVEIGAVPGVDAIDYRAETEGAFVRYRWHERDQGKEGYWTAELPNGSIEYYGADQTGSSQPDARMGISELGTFRYYLSERVDSYGNKALYRYEDSVMGSSGSTKLLKTISYVFNDAGDPLYVITLSYQDRVDPLSDCRPGYCEIMGKRLSQIQISRGGVTTDTYQITYDDELQTQSDLSRVKEVKLLGKDDQEFEARYTFEYSKALGMACDDESCGRPYLVDMGTIDGNLRTGAATLIDLNGDSLPDIINTDGGQHQVHYNQLSLENGEESQRFLPAENFPSLNGIDSSSYDLKLASIQTLDVDGNGFSDLVNYTNRTYLINQGKGRWEGEGEVGEGDNYPNASNFSDVGDSNDGGELDTTRFFDYDQNGRIDVIKVTQNNTEIFSTSLDGTVSQVSDVDQIGSTFRSSFQDGLELADMNGDGLQDMVLLREDTIIYRLYLGYGRWGDEVIVNVGDLSLDQIQYASLEDMNGDGLTDLVVVRADELSYTLNQNEKSFSEWYYFSQTMGEGLPPRDPDTVVLYADMNGNGSTDVVWVQPTGNVKFLELFPVRPNLLTKINNNIGKETEILYDSSVRESVRSATLYNQPWSYQLPHAMTLVTDNISSLDVNNIQTHKVYRYQNGFYDGVQKQFRGYQYTTMRVLRSQDGSQDALETISQYDLGNLPNLEEGFRKAGLLLEVRKFGESEPGSNLFDREIVKEQYTYDYCDLAEIPDTRANQIKFVCKTSQDSFEYEGLPTDEGVHLRVEYEHDGYGRITKTSNLGVMPSLAFEQGCPSCDRDRSQYGSACGGECLGDERYTEKSYVTPKSAMGGWRTDLVTRERDYAVEGSSLYTEMKHYYDGDSFVGLLPLGEFTEGRLHRSTELVSDNETREYFRAKYNERGAIVEEITALGEVNGPGRVVIEYDERSINILKTSRTLEDEDGNDYALVRYYRYDPVWQKPVGASREMLDSEEHTTADDQRFSYDHFGRIETVQLIDTDAPDRALTKTYQYNIQSTHTQINISQSSDEGTRESVTCQDGMLRTFQQKSKRSDGLYTVSNYRLYNNEGSIIREYQNHTSDNGACDLQAPSNIPYKSYVYEPTGRIRETRFMDADIYGSDSATRIDYFPRGKAEFDVLDNDSSAPQADTPFITYYDGQNRVVRVDRTLEVGGAPFTYDLYYDDYNAMSGYRDPDGHIRAQSRDRVGQLVVSSDPNTGITSYEYDANGNVIGKTDGRGVKLVYEYDALNRLIGTYEDGRRMETITTTRYDRPKNCPDTRCTFGAGKAVEVTYPLDDLGVGERWFGFDRRDQNTYSAHRLGGALFEMSQGYNAYNELTTQTFPGGNTFTYQYDSLGRLASLDDHLTDVSYNERGLLEKYTFGNDITTTISYDSLSREVEKRSEGPNGVLSHILASYNRRGDILEVDDQVNQGEFSQRRRIVLDNLYRVVNAEIGQADDVETLSYVYSGADNIDSKVSDRIGSAAHVGAYMYDSNHPNAASAAGDVSYTYDDAGYMITRGDQSFEWDYQGRLISVQSDVDTELNTRHYYDVGSDRVAKREHGQLTYYVFPGYEVRDGQGVIDITLGEVTVGKLYQTALVDEKLNDLAPFETNMAGELTPMSDGAYQASDAWAAEQVAAMIWTLIEGDAPSPERALMSSARRNLFKSDQDEIVYFHYDFNQSVIVVSNEDGEADAQNVYYPFGELKTAPYGLPEHRLYTQKERDLSGLTYFGARFADTRLGRFISADPNFTDLKGDEFKKPSEATNPYIFSLNNPVSNLDPNGKSAIGIGVYFAAMAIRGAAVSVHNRWKRGRVQGITRSEVAQAVVETGLDAYSAPTSAGVSILTNNIATTKAINGTEEAQRIGFDNGDAKTLGNYDAENTKAVGAIIGGAVSVGLTALGITALAAIGVATGPVTGPALIAAGVTTGIITAGKVAWSRWKKYKAKRRGVVRQRKEAKTDPAVKKNLKSSKIQKMMKGGKR